jgi:ribosomal protein L37AE/L43A
MRYERKCPVCGDIFVTVHPSKMFCCAECVAEYDDIKHYLYKKIKPLLEETIKDARETQKLPKDLIKEFMKKW